MKITTNTNGYELSKELNKMVKLFECAVNKLFPTWEIEHFYYGNTLVMTTIKDCGCEYAEFYISRNRVSFNSHVLSRKHYKNCICLTYNDECHKGSLLEIINR